MKNITKDLMSEHQNILRVIDLTRIECDKLENGQPLNTELMNDIVLFIRKYADGFHHAKEEDILFTAMLAKSENMHCNPIPVMLMEHDAGRMYVKDLVEALEQGNVEAVLENARGYCELLEHHIIKEDNILYPMAEEALTDDDKAKVEDKYAQVELSNFIETDILLFIEDLENKAF